MYVVDAAVAIDTRSGVLVVLTHGPVAPAQEPEPDPVAPADEANTPAARSRATTIQRCGLYMDMPPSGPPTLPEPSTRCQRRETGRTIARS